MKLDDRQIQERQRVFEIRYKIGAGLVLIAVWLIYSHKHSLPAIINDPATYMTASGAMFWPFFNVAFTLIALPLIVATWRSSKKG